MHLLILHDLTCVLSLALMCHVSIPHRPQLTLARVTDGMHAEGGPSNMMGLSNPSMQPGMIPIGNQMHMAPHMGMPRNMHQMNMSGIM